MNKTDASELENTSELKKAIETQHGGTATFVQSAPIRETCDGNTAWYRTVHTFNLADHPQTTRVYAWADRLLDGRQRFFAVLERETITSPREAVRAVLGHRIERDSGDD